VATRSTQDFYPPSYSHDLHELPWYSGLPVAKTSSVPGNDHDRLVQALDRHKGEPLLDSVFAMRLWLKERVEDGSQILFPSQKGGMMTRMQLLRLFKKYATAAGITEDLAHPHILRHSLCTVMAEQHADVYAIQQRAGHKNISNTMIYTHVSDKHAGEACQAALMSAFA
jgi:site-specific recombinase XerD